MVNYGIVYGLSRVRARRPPADRAGGGAGVHRPLPRALPGRRAVHDATPIDAGRGARLRLDAVRPPPPDPRDPRAQLADAQARRAPRGQHGHPGHRRGHHQGRDGALPRRARATRACRRADPADPRRAAVRGARRRRRSGRPRSSRARWSAPPSWTRRWRSTRASGRTGWTRSSGPRASPSCSTAVVGGLGRAAGADQLAARQGDRQASRPRLSRSRSARSLLAVVAVLAAAASAGSGRPRTLPLEYLIGGVLGACYVSTVLVDGAHARRRRRRSPRRSPAS